jgi:hypothetical protein
VYPKYLSVGLTRNLGAYRAAKTSALTVGTIGFQLLMDAVTGLFVQSRLDRVLDGPTMEVWIDLWVAYFERRGVTFHVHRGCRFAGSRPPSSVVTTSSRQPGST